MPPTADAGDDQNVSSGNIVRLDASNSSDLDGGIGTYQWSQISGKPVILSNADSAHAEFVAPNVNPEGSSLKFSLTVADTGNLPARDACIVNVVSQNTPPISDAGPDRTVTEGSSVTLDGTGSSDLDDGIVLYLWKQISGTPVTLSDSTAIQPTFTALRATEESAVLELLLTVEDSNGTTIIILKDAIPPLLGDTPMHVGDLDGSSALASKGNRWVATVRVTVHRVGLDGHQPIHGILFSGSWNGDPSDEGSCITDADGQCSINKNNLKPNVSSTYFSVDSLSDDSGNYYYEFSKNHDTDGDSNPSDISIVVDQPL